MDAVFPAGDADLKRAEQRMVEQAACAQRQERIDKTCETLIGSLKTRQVHAQNWAKLTNEAAGLETELVASNIYLEKATQIETDAARLAFLKTGLLTVEELRVQLADRSEWQARLAACAAAESPGQADFAARAALLLSRAAFGQREARQGEAAGDAQARSEMEAQETIYDSWGYVGDAQARSEIEAFIEAVEVEAAALEQTKTALPWLRQFRRARAEAITARQQHTLAHNKTRRIARFHGLASEKWQAAGAATNEAEQQAQELRDAWSAAKTRLKAAQERADSMDALDGKQDCEICGQPLLPQHLAGERERRAAQVQDMQDAAEAACRAVTAQNELVERARGVLARWQRG